MSWFGSPICPGLRLEMYQVRPTETIVRDKFKSTNIFCIILPSHDQEELSFFSTHRDVTILISLPPVLNQTSLHIHAVWPGCNTVDWPTSSPHPDIPKNDNGQFQKWKIPFKKFSRLMFNIHINNRIIQNVWATPSWCLGTLILEVNKTHVTNSKRHKN